MKLLLLHKVSPHIGQDAIQNVFAPNFTFIGKSSVVETREVSYRATRFITIL